MAPQKAYKDMYLDENGDVIPDMSTLGGLAVGVPGSISAIYKIHSKFGSLPIKDLFEPAINLAKKASGIGIEIHTIGIGSNAGGLIPIVENDNGQIEYKRDNSGRLITSVLNKNILKEIANAGNGSFYHFTNDGQNYTHINKAIQSMEKRVINSHEYSEYDHRYQPLAFVSLLFFLVSFIFPTRNNYDKTN